MIRNFYPSLLLYGAVVYIYVGAFVETVVRGFLGGGTEEVVDISEASER